MITDQEIEAAAVHSKVKGFIDKDHLESFKAGVEFAEKKYRDEILKAWMAAYQMSCQLESLSKTNE